MAAESCATCRFFKADQMLVDLVNRSGWCLRYPPRITYIDQATNRNLTRFGTTMSNWWCGEYKTAPVTTEGET